MKDKPTYEECYKNGNIQSQSWKKNGKCHRTNGLPAIIYYYKDGNIKSQQWLENGNRLSNKKVLKKQYQFFNKILTIDNKGLVIL